MLNEKQTNFRSPNIKLCYKQFARAKNTILYEIKLGGEIYIKKWKTGSFKNIEKAILEKSAGVEFFCKHCFDGIVARSEN